MWSRTIPAHATVAVPHLPVFDKGAAERHYSRRSPENLGRDRKNRTECQNRSAPSRIVGERYLRCTRPRPYAFGANIWNTQPTAAPGDFIYIPPYVPHQEINALAQEPLECVIARNDQEAIVVNLDIEPVEKPESVAWIDAIHRR